MKELYDASLVLAIDEPALFAATAVLAAKKKVPLQFGVRSRADIASAREAARTSGAQAVLAGIIAPKDRLAESVRTFAEAGVDVVQASGFAHAETLREVARVVVDAGLAFTVVLPSGAPVVSVIEQLDADAALRPWHYLIEGETAPGLSAVLASLFRQAPTLAHRVVGVIVTARNAEPATTADAIRDLLTTFGMTFVGIRSEIGLHALIGDTPQA